MRYLIDSSLFVSSLDENDPHYSQSSAIVASLGQHTIITPSLVVAEVINSIFKVHPEIIKTVYRQLLRNETVSLDQAFLKSYMRRFPLSIKLKTSDLVIAITAATTKSTLVTWDKQLYLNARQICDVAEPLSLIHSKKK